MATAWLFHDSLVRQALLSRQHSCYRVNLCHLIGLIITFHQRYWSVSPLLKGMGEKRWGKIYQENMNMKKKAEGKRGTIGESSNNASSLALSGMSWTSRYCVFSHKLTDFLRKRSPQTTIVTDPDTDHWSLMDTG